MRQFMEYRGKREPLTEEILELFGTWLEKFPRGANQEYQVLVSEEYQRLKEAYMKIE